MENECRIYNSFVQIILVFNKLMGDRIPKSILNICIWINNCSSIVTYLCVILCLFKNIYLCYIRYNQYSGRDVLIQKWNIFIQIWNYRRICFCKLLYFFREMFSFSGLFIPRLLNRDYMKTTLMQFLIYYGHHSNIITESKYFD